MRDRHLIESLVDGVIHAHPDGQRPAILIMVAIHEDENGESIEVDACSRGGYVSNPKLGLMAQELSIVIRDAMRTAAATYAAETKSTHIDRVDITTGKKVMS